MSVEQDIERARTFSNQRRPHPTADMLEIILGHLEERLRVNVGLVQENAKLRKQLALSPPAQSSTE